MALTCQVVIGYTYIPVDAIAYFTLPEVEMSEREQVVSDGLVNVPEAARFLGLSRSKIYQLMDRGELRYAKLGKNRRIPRSALVELAAKSLVASGAIHEAIR
jgi:excisionase family DNA binding protein